MKSKYLLCGFLVLLALLTVISCKSTPPPPPAAPPAAEAPKSDGPDQASLDALNAAIARAEAARKLVSDFYGRSLLPEDWQGADSLFGQAEQQKNTSTLRQTQESTERYNKAAAAFEAMSGKTIGLYYETKRKELIDARAAAVSAGAMSLIPDYLLEVDNIVADAEAKYQAMDYYGAKDAAEKGLSMYEAQKVGLDAYNVREAIAGRAEELIPDFLWDADELGLGAIDKYLAGDYKGAKEDAVVTLSMYESLAAGLNAYKVREEIVKRGFERFDPRNIQIADDTLRSAADDYMAEKFASAKDKGDEALLRYNLALKTAWQGYAAERRTAATTERQRALDFKANVAVRQDFNSAQTVFNQANTAFQAQRFEEAAMLYEDCESKFAAAAREAREKQQIAEEALRRANQRMAESDQIAKDAEIILEGGI